MKSKIFIFMLFILIAVVSIFVFLNPAKIPLHITPSISFQLPVALIILGSVILGFAIMLVISVFREVKMAFDMRKIKRKLAAIEKSKTFLKNAIIDIFKGNKKSAKKQITNAIKLDDNLAYYLTLNKIEDDFAKKEELLNKLPFEISKYYLIKHYFNNGKYATLINFAQDIIEDKTFKNNEILAMIRDSFKNVEKYSEAIEMQERIIGLKNSDKTAEVKILVELSYLNTKKDYSTDKVNSIIKKFTNLRPAYFLKFNALKESNISEALKTLADGFRNTSDSVFICEMINTLNQSDNEKVIAEGKKLLSKFKDKKAELLTSIIYFLENKLDKAENIAKKYLDDEKLKQLASIIYAEILYRKDKNLKEIIEIFRKVLGTQDGIRLKFYCKNCNSGFTQWHDYCPKCNSFDSIYSVLEKEEKNGF